MLYELFWSAITALLTIVPLLMGAVYIISLLTTTPASLHHVRNRLTQDHLPAWTH